MTLRLALVSAVKLLSPVPFCGQEAASRADAFTSRMSQPAAPGDLPSRYTVDTGTRIPLGLINSVSTKHSEAGDRVYL